MNARTIVAQLLETENPEMCARCGGKCCAYYPGITSPEQWGAPDKEVMRRRIAAALDSGRYVLDDWVGNPKVEHELDLSVVAVYMVRPAVKDGKRRLLNNGPCTFLGNSGCDLSYTDRPRQCSNLVPGADGEDCSGSYDKRQAAIDWMDYQDVLY